MKALAFRTARTWSRALARPLSPISTPRTRFFSTTPRVASGHSRWSKIKHDKGKNDLRRGAEYSRISREITAACHDGGTDNNLRLNAAVAVAKKAGMPKERITAAVKRGLGQTSTGAQLEPVVLEAMGPGKVALVVDGMTDNKLRTLQDLKMILHKHKAQATQTSYLFTRKGIIRVRRGGGGHEFEAVLESALEIDGTEDVEDVEEGEDGKPEIVISTESLRTGPVVAELKKNLPGIEIIDYSVGWVPNEDTMVEITDEKTEAILHDLVNALEEYPDVTSVYLNLR